MTLILMIIIIKIFSGIFLCTLLGTIIFTIRFLKKYRAIRKDILNADLCGDEIQSMVKNISKRLGVHKEIQVVILAKAGGPMLYGVLKPRIILPRIYDPQQLNMIFTHELIHYKHHDLIWKHLANIICCIYWFQPALKDVFYQLDQWGETYCDRTVCEYLPDVKGYFSTIIDISMEEIRYGRYTTAGLYESR